MREVTPQAVALIRQYEGWWRPLPDGRAAPYLCPAGFWTIAYGARWGLDGRPVTRDTEPVTRAEGEGLLAREVAACGAAVDGAARIPLTDNQRGALASFVYNLGPARLKGSTLLRRLNAGLFDDAAEEFPKWCMAGTARLPGLVARRAAEKAMFLTPDPQPEALAPPANPPALARLTRFLSAFDAAKTGQFYPARLRVGAGLATVQG